MSSIPFFIFIIISIAYTSGQTCYKTTTGDEASYTCIDSGIRLCNSAGTDIDAGTKIVCNAAATAYGGSTTNTRCYPNSNTKAGICLPAPASCTNSGVFPISTLPDAEKCKYYYRCESDGAGSFTQTIHKCKGESNFSGIRGGCTLSGCDINLCSSGTKRQVSSNCYRYEECDKGNWVARDCSITGNGLDIKLAFNNRTSLCTFNFSVCGDRPSL